MRRWFGERLGELLVAGMLVGATVGCAKQQEPPTVEQQLRWALQRVQTNEGPVLALNLRADELVASCRKGRVSILRSELELGDEVGRTEAAKALVTMCERQLEKGASSGPPTTAELETAAGGAPVSPNGDDGRTANPNRAKAKGFVGKANQAFLEGDEQGAAGWISKAIAADPSYPEAYLIKANLAKRTGDAQAECKSAKQYLQLRKQSESKRKAVLRLHCKVPSR